MYRVMCEDGTIIFETVFAWMAVECAEEWNKNDISGKKYHVIME